MKNKKIVVLVISALLLVGLGVFWYRSKKKNETQTLPDGTVVDKNKQTMTLPNGTIIDRPGATMTLPNGTVVPIAPAIPGGVGNFQNKPAVVGIKTPIVSIAPVRPGATDIKNMSAFDQVPFFQPRLRRTAKHVKIKKKIYACGNFEYTRDPGESTEDFIASINSDIASFVNANIQAVFYTVDSSKSNPLFVDDTTQIVIVYYQYHGFEKDMPVDFTAGACDLVPDAVGIDDNTIIHMVHVCYLKSVIRIGGVDFGVYMASINDVITNTVNDYSPYINCIGYVPDTTVLDNTTTSVQLYFEYYGPALSTYPAGTSIGSCEIPIEFISIKDNNLPTPPTTR